jgi:T-complex protein 1 subunit theta
MLVLACKMQEEECGDATNFTVTFAGELLSHAENLIRMGLHPSQIIIGYEEASKRALALLNDPALVALRVTDPRNAAEVAEGIKASIASKVPNYGDFFSQLVAKACINSLPDKATNFDIDNIRVVHILGSSVEDSTFLSGFLVKRNAEGSVDRMVKPRIAVFSCPLDTMQAETKGTVLIQNAKELLNYSKGEEDLAEAFVAKLVNANINVVVSGGSISDIVLHFLDKYKIMAVKILSKFELRRVARAVRATILSELKAPSAEETGSSDDVGVEEIASERVVIFRRNTEDCKLSTIVLRGSTTNILEDIERAIDDGVHNFRSLLHNPEFVAGAGAIEIVIDSSRRSSARNWKRRLRS